MFQQPSKTKEPDSVEHAYNYALFLLGLSMRTEFEMKRKMTMRGYHADIVDQTVTKLYEEKLLDDQRYAEVYLNNLREYRSFGYYGIKKKLTEKHLPKEVIEKLLERELTVDQELEIGQRFMAKELGKETKASLLQEEKQKLARKLQTRGFRTEIISKLLFK